MRISLIFLVIAIALTWQVECRGRGGGGRGGGRSGGRSGGWFGSRSSSSSRSRSSSSWFGGSKSKGTKSNSYPKQQWGTSSSYPKQPWGKSVSPSAIGGGGFVNPKSYGGYGSRTSSFGRTGSVPTYSYRSPGYGTSFGTRFPGGMGAYGYNGYGFSKKRLGLGVGAGFLGGAMTGMAVMSVYHRYQMYKHMMYMHQYGRGYHDPYYNDYYMQGRCMQGCPYNAHCEYGFCECDYGFTKRNGACYRHGQIPPPRTIGNPFDTCSEENNHCHSVDMNMICNTNTSKCACREDFKWNQETNECQFHLNVDCSNITYNTKTSKIVEEAANTTLLEIEGSEEIKQLAKQDNMTAEEVMQTSMLPNIDPQKASENEIQEAFCRDIDSFSWEFGNYEEPPAGPSWGQIVGLILFVVIIQSCCYYAQRKKIKELMNKLKGNNNEDRPMTDVNNIPLTDQQPNNVIPNPGYQPQPTPLHVNLPAESQPLADPAPIPPTQPGYTNVYPPLNGDANAGPTVSLPYPVSPNPAPAYVPQQPYPPAPAGGAQPGGALPYPAAPEAPGGSAPAPVYPPYPTQAQPPYNPNA